MKSGALYHGLVFDKTHYTWLSNVADRASLKYVVVNGNPLYQEDLSTHLKSLFTDQLEESSTVQMSDDEESDGDA